METTTIIGYVANSVNFLRNHIRRRELNFDLIMNISLPSIFYIKRFALLASIPFKYFKKMPKHFRMVFTKDKKDPYEYVEIITELSKEARKKGLLALEDKAYAFEDEFLRESVLLIVDAIEPDKLKIWFEQKLDLITRRNQEELKIYEQSSLGPPACQGTPIGLLIC